MADRWMDERDRRWRDRDWRRSEDMDRGDRPRFEGGEDRSWGGAADDDDGPYGARWSGSNRDRVFGERESGMTYGGEESRAGGGYGRENRFGGGRGSAYRGARTSGSRGGWQDRDYGGVSPAMQQGEYDAERDAERYDRDHASGERGRGGRYYGDAGREPIYREEWSQGRRDYGPAPRGYDAGRMETDHRRGRFAEDYSGDMFAGGDLTSGRRGGGMWSGGTGGYDYERGYGDGGRQGGYGPDREDRGERWERRGREMGRDTGDFFRRAGERVASWFGGGEHETGRDYDRRESRNFSGMGPKGYKRADERISDEVHERLTDDPYVDASNISVSVSGGEVTLSGTVENREAKHRAERCVEDISGVSHVQNNLRVDRGNVLTSPGSGYGDSVLEHQMRGENGAGERVPGNSMGGGSSTNVNGATTTGGATTASGRTGSASTDTGKSR